MNTVPSFTSIFKVFLGMLLGLLVLEASLQVLPTATGFQRANESFPIRHWKPNSSYVYSNGWNFRNPQSGRVNNYGFVNSKDYEPKGADVLVIGDSYVEAQQVLQNMTLHAVIEQESNLSTYAIGINDSQFADYINYMKYGLKEFQPEWLVIKLFATDLSYSFQNRLPQGAYFVELDNGQLDIEINPENLQQGGLRNLLKNSALLRYLFLNLRIPGKVRSFFADKPTQTDAIAVAESKFQPIMSYFLEVLNQHNFRKDRIVFVTDSDEVETLLNGSDFKNVNAKYLLSKLQSESKYMGNDLPYDGHWNYRGHYLVGEAVAKVISGEAYK